MNNTKETSDNKGRLPFYVKTMFISAKTLYSFISKNYQS